MSWSHNTVRRVAKRFGLRPVSDDEEWTVYWTDTSVLLERVMEMKRYQVVKFFTFWSCQGRASFIICHRKCTFTCNKEGKSHGIAEGSLQNDYCLLLCVFVCAENQPLSRNDWDLSQRPPSSQHEQNAQALPKRLQLFPSFMVHASRVCYQYIRV